MQLWHMDAASPSSTVLLGTAAILTGLIAGLLYGWSCSIIPGLHNLNDVAYITAMQSFNRAIQNPVFFLSFMGSAILLPYCAYRFGGAPYSPRAVLVIASAALYLVGCIGITAFGNIPLNNALNTFDLSTATAQQIVDMRLRFEGPWITLHTIRTVATVLAFICTVGACLARSTPERAA